MSLYLFKITGLFMVLWLNGYVARFHHPRWGTGGLSWGIASSCARTACKINEKLTNIS